jgi:hypothetical protein
VRTCENSIRRPSQNCLKKEERGEDRREREDKKGRGGRRGGEGKKGEGG